MAPGDGALENGALENGALENGALGNDGLGDCGRSHSRDGTIGDGSMWVAILDHSGSSIQMVGSSQDGVDRVVGGGVLRGSDGTLLGVVLNNECSDRGKSGSGE